MLKTWHGFSIHQSTGLTPTNNPKLQHMFCLGKKSRKVILFRFNLDSFDSGERVFSSSDCKDWQQRGLYQVFVTYFFLIFAKKNQIKYAKRGDCAKYLSTKIITFLPSIFCQVFYQIIKSKEGLYQVFVKTSIVTF